MNLQGQVYMYIHVKFILRLQFKVLSEDASTIYGMYRQFVDK
jgi:hypothetical protein